MEEDPEEGGGTRSLATHQAVAEGATVTPPSDPDTPNSIDGHVIESEKSPSWNMDASMKSTPLQQPISLLGISTRTSAPAPILLDSAEHSPLTPLASTPISASTPVATSPSSTAPTTAPEEPTTPIPVPTTTAADMAITAVVAATSSLIGTPTKTPATDLWVERG